MLLIFARIFREENLRPPSVNILPSLLIIPHIHDRRQCMTGYFWAVGGALLEPTFRCWLDVSMMVLLVVVGYIGFKAITNGVFLMLRCLAFGC